MKQTSDQTSLWPMHQHPASTGMPGRMQGSRPAALSASGSSDASSLLNGPDASGAARYGAVVQQYLDIRTEHSGTLILFRIGHFYEAWFDEAELLARELGLKLSSRPSGGSAPAIPQVGFAQHALESFLSRLLQRGYRVAVVEEEEEDEEEAKEVSRGSGGSATRRRTVARTLTPGTVTDAALVPADRANYLCGVVVAHTTIGMAWTDVTTGEFVAGEYDEATAAAELARIAPAEVLIPPTPDLPAALKQVLASVPQTTAQDHLSQAAAAQAELTRRYTAQHPLSDLPIASHAAGMVLGYLEALKGQAAQAAHGLDAPSILKGDALRIDPATRGHLEVSATGREAQYRGSLLWAIDRTASPMGRRMLRAWLIRPLVDLRPIQARHQIIQALLDLPDHRHAIVEAVEALPDLERLAGALTAGRAAPDALRDLVVAGHVLPNLASRLATSPSRFLQRAAHIPPTVEAAIAAIAATLAEPPSPRPLRAECSPEYATAIERVERLQHDLEEAAARLRASSGIARLHLEQNATQGWFLEVPANTVVPSGWVRRGGLAKVERYTTAQIEDLAAQLEEAEAEVVEIERRIQAALIRQVRAAGSPLRELARTLAAADALQSLATIAAERSWVRPTVDESPFLDIRHGRHPVLEQLLGDEVVPNDTHLVARGNEHQLMILTGPNMAGKSSLQRQVALLVLLAQAGSYIPAERATIGLTDGIYTRLGAADDQVRGQSTFMVEMLETAQILRSATDRSLCLFDELGRGTSTYDGMAIAWAVAEHLANGPARPRTILATHYHELSALALRFPNVVAMRMAVHEESEAVQFLYRLEPGGADRSFGIAVARMAGLPPTVLARAASVASAMEPATVHWQQVLLQAVDPDQEFC